MEVVATVHPSPPLVVLLGSPLLGGIVWNRVAPLLRLRDRDVVVPDVTSRPPHSVADVVDAVLGALPADRPLAVVAHSNAGNLVPGIVTARDVAAVVLMDAAFPAGAGAHPVAPAHLVAELAELADEHGLLPPWSRWFPDEAILALGLDAGQLAELRRVEPRVPFEFLTGTVDVQDAWARRTRGAYVSFGDAYAVERGVAASLGWRVRAVEGGHLHPLVEPEEVAAVIDEELDELIGHEPPRAQRNR
jgi:hypothetical protein